MHVWETAGWELLTGKKQKKHCQIMVTLLVCNVPQCQFSRTFNYWHRYVLLIFKAFSSLFFLQNSRPLRHPPAWSVERRQTEITYMPRIGNYVWASALCTRFYSNPAPVIRSTQFHYCAVTLLVTREPEQTICFEALRVAKRHMAFTQPTGDSRRCAPVSNLFCPLIFWPLVCLPTPFYAPSHV